MALSSFARFTESSLEADWGMESKIVSWRMTARGPEVREGDADPWRPLEWRELRDGSVKTTALLHSESDLLRWIPRTLSELSDRWEERWTKAHLRRLAGTWGSGYGAATVGPPGIRDGQGWHGVVARPCLERCEGPAFHVCLEPTARSDPPRDWWVVRDDALQVVKAGDLCGGGPMAYVDAFEPGGQPLLRNGEPAPSGAGVAPHSVAKTVAHRLGIGACNRGAAPLNAELSLTVASTGLPTEVSVKGVPADAAACLETLIWSLVVQPAPRGAPATTVRRTVVLPASTGR
jgi:hypothetical protein